MSVRICVSVTIAVPPALVWHAIEDIERHTDWMTDAVAITFRTPQHTGVGTEFECRTRVGPLRTTDVMRVTEWQTGSTMGIEHRGVVTGSGRFTILPSTDNSTHFTWDERLSFPWWMGGKAGERAAKPILRRLWRKNLEHLRDQLEG